MTMDFTEVVDHCLTVELDKYWDLLMRRLDSPGSNHKSASVIERHYDKLIGYQISEFRS